MEQVVDTTGAGDCFTAAYAVAVLEGHLQRAALRFAGKFWLLAMKQWMIYIICASCMQVFNCWSVCVCNHSLREEHISNARFSACCSVLGSHAARCIVRHR